MRITSQSQSASLRADLAEAGSRLARIQGQVASGRVIERPSDGPAAAMEALRYRRTLRGHEQYGRNVGDAKAWLGQADSALDSIDSRLTRARTLTIQAENASLSAEARGAIATELRSIADEMVSIANTDHMGRPIFAGTAATQDAYAADGTYLGDMTPIQRRVDSSITFQVIRAVADDVEAGNNPTAGLDVIDAARDRVSTAEAALGSRLAAIERVESRNEGRAIDTRAALSQAEDVDLTDAILELRTSEAAYTTALNVAARVLDHSLLNFLR